ncbi:hypothetical protein NL108_012233 [Boleophthalmus pectinirostris]|nr:hypothetical protein NL108_012233 [Boleophthalmus pectinirostris]
MSSVPAGAFSVRLTLYTGCSNTGTLSLESNTLTTSSAVPVRGGWPPSTAVSTYRCAACCSRSKDFSRTSSAKRFPSLCVCTSR